MPRSRGHLLAPVATHRKLAHIAVAHGILEAFVDEVLDQEQEPILKLSRRRDVWPRMRHFHPTIGSIFEQLRDPILAADWCVEPERGDASARTAKRAEDLTNQFRNSPGFLPWLEAAAEIAFQGWGGIEATGVMGGFGDVAHGEPLLPGALALEPFALTFETDTGAPRLLLSETERMPGGGSPDQRLGVDLTGPADPRAGGNARGWAYKFAWGQWGSTAGGNWRGTGLGVRLFAVYWFLSQNLKDWNVANERFGTPLPVGEITKGDFDTNKRLLIECFNAMASSLTGFVVPDGVKLTLLNQSMSGWTGHATLDDVLERKVRTAILGVSSTGDQGEHGTYGAVKLQASQVTPRQWKLASFLEDLGTRFLVRRAHDYLYGGDGTLRLVCKWQEPSDPVAQERRLRLAGDLGLAANRDEVYDLVGLTPPENVPDVLTLRTVAPGGAPLGFAEPTAATRRRDLATEEREAQATLLAGPEAMASALGRLVTLPLAQQLATRAGRAGRKRRGAS